MFLHLFTVETQVVAAFGHLFWVKTESGDILYEKMQTVILSGLSLISHKNSSTWRKNHLCIASFLSATFELIRSTIVQIVLFALFY